MRSLFPFFTFSLFNLRKHVNWSVKISFSSLLYLPLVTLCIVDPFLCCHLLYLIIFLLTVPLTIYIYMCNICSGTIDLEYDFRNLVMVSHYKYIYAFVLKVNRTKPVWKFYNKKLCLKKNKIKHCKNNVFFSV